MNPREKIIESFELRRPPGLVPTFELEFQLSEELFGEETLRREHLADVGNGRRTELLKRNAELLLRIAGELDYSIVPNTHWLDRDDQIKTFEYLRELAGDTYMFAVFADGTQSIPDGSNMVDLVAMVSERRDEYLESLSRRVEETIDHTLPIIEAGAEVVFMCADYCFNDGPFFSPTMFREFVTPFLKRQIDAFREAGAYTVKHTDGDIMPILDQLVECRPTVIHSLDPMAGVDIKEVKERYGDTVCLMGNVNCAYLQTGPDDKMVESAMYCLEHGGAGLGGYVYSTSNCVFKGVPLDRYLRMLPIREKFLVE